MASKTIPELDPACESAWQAYQAMCGSKQEHMDFMMVLENKKKKFNIDATVADTAKLAQLLNEHDRCVKAFTEQSAALKQQSSELHLSLFSCIAASS